MRLQHFCIGSIRTQDLLISKSFLPLGNASDAGEADIQAVWANFLDLSLNELHWSTTTPHSHRHQQNSRSPNATRSPPPHASSPHSATGSTTGTGNRSASGMAVIRADSPLSSSIATGFGDSRPVAKPLFAADSCFIYQTIHDIVLVACCPAPPTPSTASATVTRIPYSLPGRRHPPSSRGGSVPRSPGGSSLLDSQQELPKQIPVPELAFSTAGGLYTSYHSVIEFLDQLITALDRYLVPDQHGSPGTTGQRTMSTRTPTSNTHTVLAATAATKSKSGSLLNAILSAELVQLNTGIVYEILEECMSMGYPMMPALAQLDLLIFGVPKTIS
ncbi:hypothetical protein FBU30_004071 [Linnemannia zychae]|nr:hypothetical protein FBU30_004071 [Linnemannia zychae]